MAKRFLIPGINYGRNLDEKVKGAPDFQYWEFVSSDTAVRHGVKNVPTEAQWESIELLCQKVLQPLRDKFGAIKITSGFRTPILSSLTGSSTSSNHCRGEAADFELYNEDVSLLELGEYIAKNLQFHELIFEYLPYGWIHVAYRANSKVKTIKLKDQNHHFDKMTLEEIKKIY